VAFSAASRDVPVGDTVAAAVRRATFLALLAAAPLLAHLSSNGFDFPGVSNGWVCAPLCALVLVAVRAPVGTRLARLDLLALLALSLPLACWRAWRLWPMLCMLALLLYLAARMLARARLTPNAAERDGACARLSCALPRSWLAAGAVVLAAVQVGWALQGTARTDIALGGVHGASQIGHGRPLYGKPARATQGDPHTDTYGPANYEAYLPALAIASGYRAARLTTLLFTLLSALLLFLLGRRERGADEGVLLAYCWLAFPFTLYGEALALNDSILAAALLAALLARSCARRGALTAVAAWTKFSPLALVPLLAGQCARGTGGRRRLLAFGAGFALTTIVVFAPVLTHASIGSFVSRTFAFQASRTPSVSVWGDLQVHYAGVSWLIDTARVAHALTAAFAGTLAIVLLRLARLDLSALAAASAAVLIGVQASLGYYAFGYVLWFAPLVLLALVLGSHVISAPRTAGATPVSPA
jgi:Glycosyltransferase family 87